MGLGVCRAVSLLTLGLEVDSDSFCVTGPFWLLCPFTVSGVESLPTLYSPSGYPGWRDECEVPESSVSLLIGQVK